MGRAREERRARREAVRAEVAENPAAAVPAADLRLLRRHDLLARARALGVRHFSTMTKPQLEAAGAAAAAEAAPATEPPYRGRYPVFVIWDTVLDPTLWRVTRAGLELIWAAAAEELSCSLEDISKALVIMCRGCKVHQAWQALTEEATDCTRHDRHYDPRDFGAGSVVIMAG